MKKQILILLITALSITATRAQMLCVQCFNQNDSISGAVTNFILNGGFENNNCTPNGWFSSCPWPASTYYNCGITNWTCTGGGASTYAAIIDNTYAPIVEGVRALYFGNSYCHACSTTTNDTACLINSVCSVIVIPVGYPDNYSGAYGGNTGLSLSQTVT